MIKVDNLTVNYRGRKVGTMSLTPDNRLCAFEYDKAWLIVMHVLLQNHLVIGWFPNQ